MAKVSDGDHCDPNEEEKEKSRVLRKENIG